MEKNFKYEFDDSTGILYKYYYGPITINDLTDSWEHAFEANLIPKNVKGFVLDYREANLRIQVGEHKKIPEFYKKNIDIFRDQKIAIITESPRDLVIPVLVRKKDDGYYSHPFSTKEAAIKWVLS